MNLRRNGARVLGLSLLAVFGLVAFMASAAQAKQGLFLINGSLVNLLATATGGLIGGGGTLLVPGLDVEIRCNGVTVQAGSEIENAQKGVANLRYEGCVYWVTSSGLTVKPGSGCTIHDLGVAGQILAKYKLHPILVKLANGTEHKLLILVEGNETTGGKLGENRIALITSEKCNIPNLIEVKGSSVLLLLASDIAKQEVIEAPEALRLLTAGGAVDVLKYGVNDAFIDGEGFIELTGAPHTGLTWGSE